MKIASEYKECDHCGHVFNTTKHENCPKCTQFKTVEDEDIANGIVYPAHETWDDGPEYQRDYNLDR